MARKFASLRRLALNPSINPAFAAAAASTIPIGMAGRAYGGYLATQAGGGTYYPQANMGEWGGALGGVLGAGAGMLFGNPLLGSVIGSGVFGAAGGALSNIINAQWTLQTQAAVAGLTTGYGGSMGGPLGYTPDSSLLGLAGQLGAMPNMMFGQFASAGNAMGMGAGSLSFPGVGIDAAWRAITMAGAVSQGGGGFSTLSDYTGAMISRFGSPLLPGANGRPSTTPSPVYDAANAALSPLVADPFLQYNTINALRTNTGLPNDTMVGAYLTMGPGAAYSAAAALGDVSGFQSFNRNFMGTAYGAREAAGIAQGAGASLARETAGGAGNDRLITSMQGLQSALERNAQAVDRQYAAIAPYANMNDPAAQAMAAQLNGQKLGLEAQAAQVGQQVNYLQYGFPVLRAEAQAGRLAAQLSTGLGIGAGPDRQATLYGRTIGAEQGSQSAILGYLANGQISDTEREALRSQLNAAGDALQSLRFSQAMAGPTFGIQQYGRGASEVAANAAVQGMMGLGSLGMVGVAGQVSASMLAGSQAFGTAAQAAFAASGDPQNAFGLNYRAQSQVLRSGAQAAVASVYASPYAPSAAGAVSLGNADLAEQLAANDIGTGGFVPVGLRRARMSTMAQQLGQIDAYVAGAPANLRDQAAASSMGLRNSLVLAMQQDENALQYGEIGHLINVGVGRPGNFTLRAANIGDWQRMNPGGTRALGGTGAALDASPFSGMMGGSMSAGSLAQALGGSGSGTGVIEDLLRQLIAAVREQGSASGGSVGTFGMRDLTKDPREQARQNSPVR